MPVLGLGTGRITDPDAIARALEVGYRHLDTAQMYENEAVVGDGLAAADVPAEEAFVATKLQGEDCGREAAVEAARVSRERLGVDTIDLLYVHWPRGDYDPVETMAAFDELVDDGVVERVGVSNFTPDLLEAAVAASDAGVFANQVECHPLCPQPELRAACDAAGVEVVAHAPLARGAVFDVPAIEAVADAHDATAAQVSLAWLRAQGVTAIPKGSGDHVTENWASLDLELTDEEVARIDAVEERHRCVDFAEAPWN